MDGERAVVWHQKLGLSLLVTIALATFILGFMRIKDTIASTMLRRASVTFKTDEQIQNERDAKLKAADTDSDGLNDYDELYVFRTSPFLEDSDSDSVNDGVEVSTSSDPNCPKGRQCRQSAVKVAAGENSGAMPSASDIGAPTPTTTSKDQESQAFEAIIATFGDPTKLTAAQIATTIEGMSSEKLRSFISTLGVPSDVLTKADDAMLKKMLSDTMIEIAGGGAQSTTDSSVTGGTVNP